MNSNPGLGNTTRPAGLPDFQHPPLQEVVLGLQFAELRGYRIVHAGLLWQSAFRERFPDFKEQPPLEPVFETFGGESGDRGHISIQMGSGPTVPRMWFIARSENEAKSGNELVQFQADRFLHNWRKAGDCSKYPRYENIREKFISELNVINEFLKKESIGHIEPNQVEISYVNQIEFPSKEDPRREFGRVFKYLGRDLGPDLSLANVRSDPEDALIVARNVLSDPENHEPWGRLHVQARPVRKTDGTYAIRLDLTVRGEPETASIPGAMSRLDAGREALVHHFAEITTSEMHDVWGRRE